MDEDKEEAQEEEQEDKPDDDMQTEGSQEDAEAAGQDEEGANALAAAAEAEEADDMETEVKVGSPEWAEAEIKAAIEAKELDGATPEAVRENFTSLLSADPDALLSGVLEMKGQLPAEQEDDEEEPAEPSDEVKYLKRMVEFGTKVYLKTEAVAEMMNRKLKEADSLVQDAQLPGVCCWSCCSGHLKILVISRWRRARMRSRCSRDKTPSLTCSKALW